ncbi:MAG TPA: discoidin domain-containing protein [Sphingobacteriaceae bacterium]|nr:discoidin domain-containing protein [Sphingobacteriaceae bacterium]
MRKIKVVRKSLLTISLFYMAILPLAAQQKNIALNKPVTATSENPQHPVRNVVDGNISRNSRWAASTNRAPHILEIDLQKYYTINEIRVHSGIMDSEKRLDEMVQAAGFWSVKNYKLQYWDDSNWSDFPNAEVHENRLTTGVFKFSPAVTTFKIRMVVDDGEPISIMEIEAMGIVALDMPAPPTIISEIKKQTLSTAPISATINVSNAIVGKSMKFVGYNQGYYFPGSNVSGWLEYSNVNSLRVWASLNSFVPEIAVQVDKNLSSVEEFDKRKNELRINPENNRFINWGALTPLYDKPDSSSTNAMVYNYALSELKRLGIQVVLQMGSTDFNDSWGNKWKQWQRYYALAYHSARQGDVAMFAMQNEPNHRHSGPMKLDQWIGGMQIVSDAVKMAVEDVNKKYGKRLQGKFVGPVTAGQNNDWWAGISKVIRTDYHGTTVDKDLLDIFSTHSYNSPAAGYESRINNIRKVISDNHPAGQPLPVAYTEIGRWMNAYLIDKDETMDFPSLFTEWAGIYSNNMKNGGYGMWAFKFANTSSDAYPRGIKSGHHYIWQGKRIVEDAYTNLALNKPVRTSISATAGSMITDGDKSDVSAWVSDSASAEKWIEIDLGETQTLGSSVVYTGSSDGVYTGPDRIKNFRLQYLSNGAWKDIPGAVEKEGKYTQVFNIFKSPVQTSKVRFVSTDKGNLKLREIKLFAAGKGPSEEPSYDVSGIQRTGQVVRLFAKGFKEERNLLKTEASVEDNGLDSYTSFDEKSGNYYMWLVQRGLFDYNLSVNLSGLNVQAGTTLTVETVNKNYYGEVTHSLPLSSSKSFGLTLPGQSVMLVTIPAGSIKSRTIYASADATVIAGKNAGVNSGLTKLNTVSLDAANADNNKVTYISFNDPAVKNTKKVILSVKGKVDKGSKPYRLHVYAVPSANWKQEKLNWQNAPLLDKHESLVHDVGTKAFVAGELAFNSTDQWHKLDVTKLVKEHVKDGVTFILVRETRQIGDDTDKGRTVKINAVESGDKPRLEVYY